MCVKERPILTFRGQSDAQIEPMCIIYAFKKKKEQPPCDIPNKPLMSLGPRALFTLATADHSLYIIQQE